MLKTIPLTIMVAIVSLALFWGPFLLKAKIFWGIEFGSQGMEAVVQNFDGLNFLVVAKSLYRVEVINEINQSFLTGNDPIYFSAHYPLMALIIRALGGIMPLPTALLVTIIGSNILLAAALVIFFQTFTLNKKMVLLLSCLALFFPARMLSVRGVGSNEPLFIALVLTSLTAFALKKDWLSAALGSLAVLTRSPGILLFGAYGLAILLEKQRISVKLRRGVKYTLMPLALVILFCYYGYTYNDFWAYFNSGDNLHLFFPPFAIFSNNTSWITDMWREDVIYLYLFYGIGLSLLPKKLFALKALALIYGSTLLLVAHRDLARYALPLAPLVWLGYERIVSLIPSRYYGYLWVGVIPIYLLGWQFMLSNIQPINDWSIFY